MTIPKLAILLVPGILCAQADSDAPSPADLAKQIAEMKKVVEQLQRRVGELEARQPVAFTPLSASRETALLDPAPEVAAQSTVPASSGPATLTLPGGTSLNFLLDTYYGYNFNNPVG